MGEVYILRSSGFLPWALPSEEVYLLVPARTGCIFQLKVPPLHTVELLKQDIGKAIPGCPFRFKLDFREEALNDSERLVEDGISGADLPLISSRSPDRPVTEFNTAVRKYHQRAFRNDNTLFSALSPQTSSRSRARSAKPLPPSGESGPLW